MPHLPALAAAAVVLLGAIALALVARAVAGEPAAPAASPAATAPALVRAASAQEPLVAGSATPAADPFVPGRQGLPKDARLPPPPPPPVAPIALPTAPVVEGP